VTIQVGMTTSFGVVGSPIKHSLSPVIHGAAYAHLGLDFSYQSYEVTKGELRKFLSESDLAGVSVTMPLKYEAFELASSHDEPAAITRVANTLVRAAGAWMGYNTDVAGFMNCFKSVKNVKTATILGSGATARSAALAISRSFPDAYIYVVGRNTESTGEVVSLLTELGAAGSTREADKAVILESDLVVSTVPGNAFETLWKQSDLVADRPTGTLFDVAYDPWPSMASRVWGNNSISGLELLVWQATEQVKIFAESVGHPVLVADQELYKVMSDVLQDKTKST
jgi:shikimate dehydrogenase